MKKNSPVNTNFCCYHSFICLKIILVHKQLSVSCLYTTVLTCTLWESLVVEIIKKLMF